MNALELRGITKTYGERVATCDAHLNVKERSIHAVVGENGAGKSTLLGIAYGSVRPDSGRMFVKGLEVPLGDHTPARAIARGIGMVHQHFMLATSLTVLENVILGREPIRRGLVDLDRARAELKDLSARLGLAIDPDRRIGELSVGEQQRVEILKVIWRGADILLLDEPTAVLTPKETRELFLVLTGLTKTGRAIVLVTHKLDEVEAVADEVTVMRRAAVVLETSRGFDRDDIVRAMVGMSALTSTDPPGVPATQSTTREVALAVQDLCVVRQEGQLAVDSMSFTIRPGECFGIAAVQGNGERELLEALVGLRPVMNGSINLADADITYASPHARLSLGLGHVPEDRHKTGIVLELNLAENLILGRQDEFSRVLALNRRAIAEFARERLEELDIRPADPRALASSLSGGNQQKLVVSRECTRPRLRLLICGQPTRGVDIVGSKLIHEMIRAAKARNIAILLLSTEFSELRALADRIGVICRGRLVADSLPRTTSDEELGTLMTGAKRSVA